MTKEKFSKIGMIVGIIIVILGIVIFFDIPEDSVFEHTASLSFGADYYTYQYEATQNVANNIITLGRMVSKYYNLGLRYLGFFVSMIGLSITSAFGYLNCKNKELAKNSIEEVSSNKININKEFNRDVENSVDEEVDDSINEDNGELLVEDKSDEKVDKIEK